MNTTTAGLSAFDLTVLSRVSPLELVFPLSHASLVQLAVLQMVACRPLWAWADLPAVAVHPTEECRLLWDVLCLQV